MDSGSRECTVGDCEHNRDGFCGWQAAVMPVGYPPGAFYMPGPLGFIAPIGPAGLLGNKDGEGNPEADPFSFWDNCPRRRNPRD